MYRREIPWPGVTAVSTALIAFSIVSASAALVMLVAALIRVVKRKIAGTIAGTLVSTVHKIIKPYKRTKISVRNVRYSKKHVVPKPISADVYVDLGGDAASQ